MPSPALRMRSHLLLKAFSNTVFVASWFSFFCVGSANAESRAPSDSDLILKPALSFLLPGFSQWESGDYTSATVYSGVGLAGYASGIHMFRENGYDLGILKDSDRFEAVKDERNFRFSLLGIQTGKLMGELSLYHSFRSQIRSRQDDFSFIKHHETPQDIALAPFRFSYLARPTTYIPMLLFVAMNFHGKQSDKELERDPFTTSDAFYAASLNYQAGVGEEAMFRGWIMPLGMYYTGSGIWANVINSTAFTISHYPINGTGNSAFWFGSGLYFGYVTQKNDWSIGEAIFIHTWTNFLATAAEFSYRKKENRNAVLWAPPLSLVW